MVDENVLAPTRSDDQILPFAAWNTLTYEAKTGAYSFQLDETYFVLDANLLRDALEITPIDQAHQFMSPPLVLLRRTGKTIACYSVFLVYKVIIYHLGIIHNIHQRSTSPFHLAEEDLRLGNFKFVPKGEFDEVFRMPIPNELISNNIRNAPYSNAYLKMVAKHDRKVTAKKEGKKKTARAKQPKSKTAIEKSSKPTPGPKPKAAKERPSKAFTANPP
nr:hypothetical protein [Tanacetum cinerariifolium]